MTDIIKKYYYDCFFEAMYMHKNYGVGLFVDEEEIDGIKSFMSEEEIKTFIPTTVIKWFVYKNNDKYGLNSEDGCFNWVVNSTTKIYVSPKSYHVFTPQPSDRGYHNEYEECFFSINGLWVPLDDTHHLRYEEEDMAPEKCEIISRLVGRRKKKHFFMPKTEEDSNDK